MNVKKRRPARSRSGPSPGDQSERQRAANSVVRTVRLWREERGTLTRIWTKHEGKQPFSPDALESLKSLLPVDNLNDDWSIG